MCGSILSLENVGRFEVIENEGSGSCLFRAISQALGFNENEHVRIRLETLYHIQREWKHFGPRIESYWKPKRDPKLKNVQKRRFNNACCLSFVLRRREKDTQERAVKDIYFSRMRSESENGTLYELLAGAELYNFHFDYVVEGLCSAGRFIFGSCRTHECRVHPTKPRLVFRFQSYGSGQGGHWEFLRIISRDYPSHPLPLHRKIKGKLLFRLNPVSHEALPPNSTYTDEELQETKVLDSRTASSWEEQGNEYETDWPPDDTDDWTGCWSQHISGGHVMPTT